MVKGTELAVDTVAPLLENAAPIDLDNTPPSCNVAPLVPLNVAMCPLTTLPGPCTGVNPNAVVTSPLESVT